MRIVLLFVLITLSSCSSIRFYSSGKVNVAVANQHYEYDHHIEKSIDLFLWGLFPFEQSINVDDLITSVEHYKVANVKVAQYRTTQDILLSIVSFGIYIPQTYSVSFGGQKYE